MALNTAEQYFLKAKDNYPFCMEEAMENLNYALGYDPEHAGSNYLMGLIYLEQMDDDAKAEHYFEVALAIDPMHKETYLSFASMLIKQRRYKQAKELLNVASNIPGICQASILRDRAFIYEYMRNYKAALQLFQKAKFETYNDDFMYKLNEDIKRVEAKLELQDQLVKNTPTDFEQISLKVAYVSTIGK